MRILDLLFGFVVFVTIPAAKAAEFPLSSKGYSATIIDLSGKNTADAVAVGQVKRADAEEYCKRDPGGITKQYGGKLTVNQGVERVLKDENGKKVSATADCPRKKVIPDWGGSYVMIDRSWTGSNWEYTWKNVSTGEILDGSSASGAPVVEQTFRMLCPAFIK